MDRARPASRVAARGNPLSLTRLVAFASVKSNFSSITDYIDFTEQYLGFIDRGGLQATIVSQNENRYCFFQYRADGHHNVTRPINSDLFMGVREIRALRTSLVRCIRSAGDIPLDDQDARGIIRRGIYTLQQSLGAALDGMEAGRSNAARKVNGDLFERLILLLVQETGADCRSGTVRVPVVVDGAEAFHMSYQHDLVIRRDGEIRALGSVKTSSKDRLDKVFVDKFLYSRLTGTETPHFAIFLNDAQRKKSGAENRFGVNATFLPGHFKGYTIKLNPLDGVFYCDIRPNMEADPFLCERIKTIDHFFCTDLRRFSRR